METGGKNLSDSVCLWPNQEIVLINPHKTTLVSIKTKKKIQLTVACRWMLLSLDWTMLMVFSCLPSYLNLFVGENKGKWLNYYHNLSTINIHHSLLSVQTCKHHLPLKWQIFNNIQLHLLLVWPPDKLFACLRPVSAIYLLTCSSFNFPLKDFYFITLRNWQKSQLEVSGLPAQERCLQIDTNDAKSS